MKLYEYHSNNSGGGDWLTQENWAALERAGWKLYGYNNFVFDEKGAYQWDEKGFPKQSGPCIEPKYAFKYFECVEDAIAEFERVANQNFEDDGCNCCGVPHNMSEVDVPITVDYPK
jgi:hypothetical protein